MTSPEAKPKRKRLNADQLHEARVAEVRLFAKQYARPAQKGVEPNDRRYRRDVERLIKRMRPEELDNLLRGED